MDKLWTKYGDMTFETILITCHYPITNNSFMLNYGMIMKKNPDFDDKTNDVIAEKISLAMAKVSATVPPKTCAHRRSRRGGVELRW